MKRNLVLILLIVTVSSIAFPKTPYSEFRVGYFNPKDAKSGFLLGAHFGRMIDESLSWGIGADYFQKTFQDITEFPAPDAPGPNTPTLKSINFEFITRILPVLFRINYERALDPKSPLYIRGSAALGWEFVWSSVKDYEDGLEDKRYYNGFGWQVSGGLGWEISSKAVLFGDIFYNGSKVKRNSTSNSQGLPTWEELDISGLGLKAGVSIVGFGF
jgi:hypothetical protein